MINVHCRGCTRPLMKEMMVNMEVGFKMSFVMQCPACKLSQRVEIQVPPAVRVAVDGVHRKTYVEEQRVELHDREPGIRTL